MWGTATAATNTGGDIIWRETYTPYGEIWGPEAAANLDRKGFTGHTRDTDTGLTYMQARYYDPVIGRFLSNDPVGFAEGGVDFFNRYSYTFNNPVNMVDPDGRDPEEPSCTCKSEESKGRLLGRFFKPKTEIVGPSSGKPIEIQINIKIEQSDPVVTIDDDALEALSKIEKLQEEGVPIKIEDDGSLLEAGIEGRLNVDVPELSIETEVKVDGEGITAIPTVTQKPIEDEECGCG